MKLRDPATVARSPVARPRRRGDGRRHRARRSSSYPMSRSTTQPAVAERRDHTRLARHRGRGRRRRACSCATRSRRSCASGWRGSSTSRRRRPTVSLDGGDVRSYEPRIGNAAEEEDRAASCGPARRRRTACRPARWSRRVPRSRRRSRPVAAAATVPLLVDVHDDLVLHVAHVEVVPAVDPREVGRVRVEGVVDARAARAAVTRSVWTFASKRGIDSTTWPVAVDAEQSSRARRRRTTPRTRGGRRGRSRPSRAACPCTATRRPSSRCRSRSRAPAPLCESASSRHVGTSVPPREMERRRRGELRVEAVRPLRVEVHRVGEHQRGRTGEIARRRAAS